MQINVNPIRNVVGVLLLMLTIGCIIGSMFAIDRLLSSATIPAVIALLIGIALSLPLRGMWKWLTGSSNIALTIILNTIVTAPLLFCLIFMVNDSKAENSIQAPAVVTRLYTKTRHQSKRVGRNQYVQGPPYKVHFMEIVPSGYPAKDLEISKKEYGALMKGDTVLLSVTKGLLGLIYFDRKEIIYPVKASEERKRESLRQQRHRAYQEHVNKVLRRDDRTPKRDSVAE